MDVLYKPVAAAAAIVVLLELDELEFAKRFEHVLEILLGDTKVDVSHVETVEGNRVGIGVAALGVANLTVLLRFGELHYDRDT